MSSGRDMMSVMLWYFSRVRRAVMYPQVQNPQGSVVATIIAMLLVYTVRWQRHETWGE